MTHLSDFSYLQRCSFWTYITVYLLYSIYRNDKFKCLRPKAIFSGELKSIITVMLLLMMAMQFLWDIVSTYVKYEEGFLVHEGHIITKPFQAWTSTHQKNMMAMDYVECVTFSLQIGVFFLMQCFWNYLSNTVAKKSFMSSWEFRLYIIWALCSMAMFPILQWVYRDDVEKREIIPQLAYGCESLVSPILGIRNHFRFRRIIALSKRSNNMSSVNAKAIIKRLSYFKDMNLMVIVVITCYASSFIILCVDGLTEAKIINSNKFATDALIANANICSIFLWLCLISIFHPRPQYTRKLVESTQNESTFRYSTSRQQKDEDRSSNHIHSIDNGYNKVTPFVSDKSDNMMSSTITTTTDNQRHHNNFTANATGSISNNHNNDYMRTLSPMTMDYQYSINNDTNPLTSATALTATSGGAGRIASGRPLSPQSQFSYQHGNHTRSLAIEDPYSSEPVMFSMMDISSAKQQYHEGLSSPAPYERNQIVTSPMHPTINEYSQYDEEDDIYSYTSGHQQSKLATATTVAPQRIRRPSWEAYHTTNYSPQFTQAGEQQMVQDWLRQSPNRRNA